MDNEAERALLRKVTLRLIPFLFLLYIVAYLDRTNLAFAKKPMHDSLGISDSVFGVGSGIFFLGYFLFEVPSNLILARVGARRWIARILMSWGCVAVAMMFTRNTVSFYSLRFLLGLAEAGFFPGIILYLTFWYTAAERAHVVGLFMTATALSSVIGGPVSGLLLTLHGAGLANWQWLFLLEGVPAILLGFVVLVYLPDGPQSARWLEPEERARLAGRLEVDRAQHPVRRQTLRDAVATPAVWVFAVLYFLIVLASYGFTFWAPEVIRIAFGLKDTQTVLQGALTAAPFLVAAIGMVLVGAHSDRTGERRWHVAVPCAVGALGYVLCACAHSAPWFVLLALSITALGLWSTLGPFWTLPTTFLRDTAAAGGIAMVNSIGNLGGFAGPAIMGALKQHFGNFTASFLVLAGASLLGAFVALSVRPPLSSSGSDSSP